MLFYILLPYNSAFFTRCFITPYPVMQCVFIQCFIAFPPVMHHSFTFLCHHCQLMFYLFPPYNAAVWTWCLIPFHLIIITLFAYENNANPTLHPLVDDRNNPYFLRVLHLSWRRSLWYHAGGHDESHRTGQCKRHHLMPAPLDFILLSLFPISFKEINSTWIHNKIWWLI